MKQFHDYKKQFRLVLVIGFVLLPALFIHAQTASEIRQQISTKNSEIENLERQIDSFQAELVELGKEKNSLNKNIQELNLTRKQLNAEISITQTKIDKTNLQIKDLSSDILDKEESIGNDVKAISLDLRRIAELEYSGMTEVILSNNNFTSIWTDIDNMVSVRQSIIEKIDRLRGVKIILEDDREETIDAKNKLVNLRTELADQKKIVDGNKAEKDKLLSQTKNSEANYQKLIANQTAKKNALEQEIEEFESKLKFILDPNSLPGPGILSWPLDGSILVTSPYGPRWGRFHRGTDFRASVGTPVKAMADGMVIGTGDTDVCCPGASFGKWILVQYDNGLSGTYAHLSLVKAQKGQRVQRGEVISYSGNSGSSTGPHLHVSVYVSSGVKVDSFESKSYPGRTLTQPISATEAYLDPMFYLPKL